ncbi:MULTISPECIES: DUF3347 domain-containing protein [unclassified Flavobacterium]|uniref:DUF3347 domain-containing protein n=1 Tax=unclassified Flavobacterium TaxID=196869 RepID=UPI003F907E88
MKSKITLFLALSLFLSVTMAQATTTINSQENTDGSTLTTVFDHYFSIKDALVKTDGKQAAIKAKELVAAVNAVKMTTLSKSEHLVWMKVYKKVQADAQKMGTTQNIKTQRAVFVSLSGNMQLLLKSSNYSQPVYAQFCPMANGGKGASWLSKEKAIKNPYYGNQMLRCGGVTETIK